MTASPADHQSRVRVVFFGTPDFAVPALTSLGVDDHVDLALVVTRPDRPSGRKQRLQAPSVKLAATELGVPVLQPTAMLDTMVQDRLRALSADVFIVAAFGRIFGRRTLAIPRLGCLNLHASILPAYRGASPIAAAILQGETTTGVSLMKMTPGLDTGPVLATVAEPISATDTTDSLTSRLAERAADLLGVSLVPYVNGELTPVAQPPAATLTRPLVKDDGRLDWTGSAEVLERQIRAMWPWPRAWSHVASDGEAMVMQVHAAHVTNVHDGGCEPAGSLVHVDGTVAVQCGVGALALDLVQLPGGRPRPFSEFADARGLTIGESLASPSSDSALGPLVTRIPN